MKHAKNESESSRMLPKNVTSPSTDEGSSGGSLPGGGGLGSGLKKGPWTSAEDAILVEYVQKHGEGNWNAVQKHSGLSRCGKSCRLRWANHLRPNLKKGAFTAEEEGKIIELHAKMGNKWARMAASLPGRTDNEIKNYWNTRIKRRQRAGLPIYPSTVPFESSENQQQDLTIGDFATDDKMQIDGGLLGNGYCIPSIQFDNYSVTSAGPLTYAPTLPAYSFTNMLCQDGFESSQTHGFVLNPAPLNSKRLRVSDTLLPAYPGNELSVFDNSVPYDPDPISMNIGPFDNGSHSLINGNFSTPRPLAGTVKSELPSLQYTTNETTDPSCYWAYAYPSSPPPEAIETYIQSPPTVSVQSECSSPRNSNSGLLEEVLHESHALLSGKSKQLLSDKSSNSNSSSAMTPSDMMDNSSANNFCDADRAWEDCDPISPLGGSASSIFNEYTPPVSGSSSDELPLPSRVPLGSGINLPDMAEDGQIKPRPECLRPDVLLGCPSWLVESNSQMAKEHTDMNNAMETLLADDNKEQKPVLSPGTGTTSTSSKWGQDSCQWNNMPSVCQIPDLR